MFRISIDGKTAEFDHQITVFQAAKENGIDIPGLCHDERLRDYGGCRLCVVQLDGNAHPVTACTTPIRGGMAVSSETPDLDRYRKTLLKLMMDRKNFNLNQIDRNKDFYRYLEKYGLLKGLTLKENSEVYEDLDIHPFIHVDMNKCINCYRCVRICDEVQGQFVWKKWLRGDDVTLLADGSKNLTESSCVSCGACADTCPTGAIEDVSVIKEGHPEEFTHSICSYCGTGCEINIGTSHGKIVQILPVLDSPVNRGHLCVKGRYSFSFVDSPDRVTDPMIRVNGKWTPSTWDGALEYASEKLRDTRAQYGPDSIGVLGSSRATNEENYLTQKFARVVIGTNNVDSCARVCHAPTAAGMGQTLGTGAATNSFSDIESARTILLFGTNTTENHPVVGARIKQQKLRGSRLIVVDPRKTELATYADIHLQIRPGTNIPMINAIANVIVEEGMVDNDFLQGRVDGYAEFRDYIRPWTPERAGAICGVEPELIRKAARIYAEEKPSMMFHGLGITEHSQGTDSVIDLVNLALLTGNLGKKGAGVNPLRGQNNVQGSAHMGCEPSKLTGYVPIATARTTFENIWKVKLPEERGLDESQMMDAAISGKFKALWVIGWDLYQTNPDIELTEKSLSSMDFIIIQDLFFNETAKRFGSVFFPAVSSYEKDGTFMNSERRVQRVRRAIPPRGNAKADWEIIQLLAQKMGYTDGFDFDSPEAIWNEIRMVWGAGSGITYERINKHGLQWPCETEHSNGTGILHVDRFSKGERTSLVNVDYVPSREVADSRYPILLSTGRSLFQFNASTMTDRSGNKRLHRTDHVYLSLEDAKDLNVDAGDRVRVESKFGSAVLEVSMDYSLAKGVAFATFNDPETLVNRITGPYRDSKQNTPEYKVTAVRIEKVEKSQANHIKDMP